MCLVLELGSCLRLVQGVFGEGDFVWNRHMKISFVPIDGGAAKFGKIWLWRGLPLFLMLAEGIEEGPDFAFVQYMEESLRRAIVEEVLLCIGLLCSTDDDMVSTLVERQLLSEKESFNPDRFGVELLRSYKSMSYVGSENTSVHQFSEALPGPLRRCSVNRC